jgi:hypothetical protein
VHGRGKYPLLLAFGAVFKLRRGGERGSPAARSLKTEQRCEARDDRCHAAGAGAGVTRRPRSGPVDI